MNHNLQRFESLLLNEHYFRVLHSSGLPVYVFPKQRTELVAYDTVEDTTGLLRIYQIHIDLTGCLDGGSNRLFGNLVKADALGLFHRDAESR